MAKRQTRRSISVKAETYARVELLALKRKDSCSNTLEELIDMACTAAGIPTVDRDQAIAAQGQKSRPAGPDAAGGIFTF